MKQISALTSFVLLFLFIQPTVKALPDPIKFGKIEKSWLEMTQYDKDTTAEAVVICDYGSFDPVQFQFRRIVRIKVLKKTGCDLASFSIQLAQKSMVSGVTYNLVNGEIEKTKLKSESIFEEDVERRYFIYKIGMPNVTVGSVFDIEFSFAGIPYAWYFQSSIPVIWSELRIVENPSVGIQKNFFGFEKLAITEPSRWVAKDVPALRSEKYMNSINNYYTKFELEFSYVNLPGYFANYTTSWNAVNTILLDKTSLGDELRTMTFMSDEANTINQTYSSNKEKLWAAYDLIRKSIRWNNRELLFPRHGNSIKQTLKKGTGNAGEINLALILLLQKLNFEVYPVVASTRDNGLLSPLLPSIDKLNYMIALVKLDGKDILLDATEDYLPAGYLPERCINGMGRILDKTKSDWIALNPGGIKKTKRNANLNLNEDGTISGEWRTSRYEYASYLYRKEISQYNDKNEYLKSLENNNPGIKINNYEDFDLDSIYKPAISSFSFNYIGNIEKTDSTIIFNPFFVDKLAVNPFNRDERKMPIDFISPIEQNTLININIPEGYKLATSPSPQTITLPENGGKFFYRVVANELSVQVQCNYNISKANFFQKDYPALKQLFADIIKKQNEPLTFIKK